MRKILFLIAAGLVFWSGAAAKETRKEARKTRVACVGNSVTYGYLLPNREQAAYPAQLQELLGDGYEVANFGHSGATLLRKGHRPYSNLPECQAAVDFAGDIVVIHLGLNDTDPRNWPNYQEEFIQDYLDLMDGFRKANSDCRIYICRMTPIMNWHPRFKSGTRDWYWQVQSAIEEIARIADVPLIDLQPGLYNRPDLMPDALHPNAEGAKILARTVYGALTGDHGGLRMPIVYSDHMVLQRDRALRIAGTADTGERVTVRFGKEKRQATAGLDGSWAVTLGPLAASAEPERLEIATPSRKLVYEDVLVGDVWLCSGQSNMAFRVDQSVGEEQQAQRAYAETRPNIRLFDMKARWETYAVEWDAGVLDSLNRLQYYHDTSWSVCDAEHAARFSAVGFAFGRMLADSLRVPVGLIHNAIGGSPAEAWIDRKTLDFEFPDILSNWTRNDFIQDWVRGRAALNVKKSENPRQRHPYEPCYLFESGIQPLDRFPIKGVIWYQGESNAHNIEAHERLFQLLVASWRSNWDDAAMPFYFVQLSSLNRPSWPRFRDSQRQLMERLPQTGMAVCTDLGDSLDVHPRRKQAVGERLGRWALNRTYGFDVVPSGPLFRSAEAHDGAVLVTFDYADGLKSADGGALRTFEVAEFDGRFYPAEAVVRDGRIEVRSDRVKHPRLIRYGWQPFTRANLVNGDGLPASTFRAEVAD